MDTQNRGSIQWIEGCKDWIESRRILWIPYYVNFMFDGIPGNAVEVNKQMHRAMVKFYGRFSTEFHRQPRSQKAQVHIPLFWLFPDKPVWKHRKLASLSEFQINDGGLHYNGAMLIPRFSYFRGCPIAHLRERQERYARHGIRRIHAMPVYESKGMSDYACKNLKRNMTDESDVLVLPRTAGELDPSALLLGADERALKALMAATNCSPELAEEIEKIRQRVF